MILITFSGVKKSSLFSGKLTSEQVHKALHEICGKYNGSVGNHGNGELEVWLCPGGSIRFKLENDKLSGEAQTNFIGPGFHKVVVGFIDDLQKRLKIEFIVDDETNYWDEHDYDGLKREHVIWLGSVLKGILDRRAEDPSIDRFLLSWSMGGWEPSGLKGVISPMGNYTFDELSSFLTNIEEFAKNFFLWSNQEKDALYHRQIALFLLWNEFCWVEPRNKSENVLARTIITNLADAHKLDPALPLPIDEWKELAHLSGIESVESHIEITKMDPKTNIGYRRNEIIVPLSGGWSVHLPGRFMFEQEVDGRGNRKNIYLDSERSFRITAYGSGETDVEFAKSLSDAIEKMGKGGSKVEHSNKDYICSGYIYPSEYNGITTWMLQGRIINKIRACLVTITFTDQKWHNWAVNTFKSMEPPQDKNPIWVSTSIDEKETKTYQL